MKNPLLWICVAFFVVPFGLAFVPGLPAHGFGQVWYLLPLYFFWRRPKERKRLLLFGLGMVVQILAYPDPDLGFLGWVLLWPYLLSRECDDGANPWRAAILYGFLRAHVGFYWLGNIHFAAWIAVSAMAGVVFSFCIEGSLRWIRGVPFALRLSIGWLTFEWMHSWFAGGFPWLYLSHTQYEYLPVIQAADIVGAYGISFLVIYVQAAVFDAWRRRCAVPELFVAGTLLAAALVYGFVRHEEPEGEHRAVLMVQSAFPHSVKEYTRTSREDVLAILEGLTREGLNAYPETELIIWPETMHPFPLIESNPGHFRSKALRQARMFRRPFIYGVNSYADYDAARQVKSHNTALLVDAEGQLKEYYRKQRLVPMGEEFLPRRFLSEEASDAFFAWLVGNLGYPRSCDLQRGEKFVLLDAGPGLRSVPLICFEGLYADLGREAALVEGCDLLLHLVNNGWFSKSFEQRQSVASWVYRAVETRTPFLSCANAGVSCGVGPSGRFFCRLDRVFETGFVAGRVPPRWKEPLFLRGGRWILTLGLGLAAIGFLVRDRLRRRREAR